MLAGKGCIHQCLCMAGFGGTKILLSSPEYETWRLSSLCPEPVTSLPVSVPSGLGFDPFSVHDLFLKDLERKKQQAVTSEFLWEM